MRGTFSRPSAATLLLVLSLLLGSTLASSLASTQTLVITTPPRQEVYLGTNQDFTAPFNLAVRVTSCQTGSGSGSGSWCNADAANGTFGTSVTSSSPAPSSAVAGTGVYYTILQRCSQQVLSGLNKPVATVKWTYVRQVNETIVSSTGSSSQDQATTTVYAQPDNGTADVNQETSPLISDPPVKETFASSAPRAERTLQQGYPVVAFNADETALLWASSTASALVTDTAHTDANVQLEKVAFTFANNAAPTFDISPNRSAQPSTGDGVTWYHGPVTYTVQPREPASCPKVVTVAENGSAPTSYPMGFNVDPVLIAKNDPGQWTENVSATNYQNAQNQVRISFGIDTQPPSTTAGLSPASATGTNGWYSSAVQATFSCSDDVSGCFQVSTKIGSGSASPFVTSPWHTNNLPDGEYDVACVTSDHSTWTSGCTVHVKVDTTKPGLALQCTPQQPGGNTRTCSDTVNGQQVGHWFNAPVQVDLACQDITSGVNDESYQVDGGAATPGASTTVSAEGRHTVGSACHDVAGNLATTNGFAYVDMTPLGAPTVASDQGSITQGVLLDLSADAGDTLSPLLYDARITWYDGSVSDSGWVSGPSWVPGPGFAPAVPDGETHVTVTVKDQAGNPGPSASDPISFNIDTTPPQGTFVRPVKGTVYVNDQEYYVDSTSTADPIAVGPLTIRSNATDAPPAGHSYASGLMLWDVTVADQDFTCDPAQRQCNATYTPSSWTDSTQQKQIRTIPEDHATNGAQTPAASTQARFVSLIGFMGTDANGAGETELHWQAWNGAGTFQEYTVLRTIGGSTPVAIAHVTSSSTTTYTDGPLVPGVTYQYQVQVKTASATYGSNSVSGTYSGGGGGGSCKPLTPAANAASSSRLTCVQLAKMST